MGSGANAAVGMAAHGEAEAAGADGKRSAPGGGAAAAGAMGTAGAPGAPAGKSTRGVSVWIPQKWELIIIVLTVAP
jgi:hypothetical protein